MILATRLIERVDDLGIRLVGPRNRARSLTAHLRAGFAGGGVGRLSGQPECAGVSGGATASAFPSACSTRPRDVDRFARVLAGEAGNFAGSHGAAAA